MATDLDTNARPDWRKDMTDTDWVEIADGLTADRDSYRDIAEELARAAEIFFQTGERDPLRTALAKAAELGIPPKEDPNKGTPL